MYIIPNVVSVTKNRQIAFSPLFYLEVQAMDGLLVVALEEVAIIRFAYRDCC